MRLRVPRSSPLALIALAGLGVSLISGCGSSVGSSPKDVSGRYILALCDGDMQASSIVDRQLAPRMDGDADKLTVIGLPIADGSDERYTTPFAQIGVSNSVMGPPQAMAVSVDGRWGYVIENQGPAPANATTVDELPNGNKLTRVDLTNPMAPMEAGVVTVGTNPMAVDISPDGGYLCVVSQEKRKQIQIIPVSEGGMGEPADWPLLGSDDDENIVPTCVSWHPSGNFVAITVPSVNQVVFYRVSMEAGKIQLEVYGEPVVVGRYPYSGRFTPDGRFYITTDMQWGDEVPGVFVEPPQGQLSVVQFAATKAGDGTPTHQVVSAAPVGINPEGLAVSPDGTMVATANLIRSFLPETDPRLTRGGSISLLQLDRSTGRLSHVEEYPIDSMPIGLSFDAKGNFLVVTQFRSFDPEVISGELAFFKVYREGQRLPKNDAPKVEGVEETAPARTEGPGLRQADFFVGVGKGPHGILIVR